MNEEEKDGEKGERWRGCWECLVFSVTKQEYKKMNEMFQGALAGQPLSLYISGAVGTGKSISFLLHLSSLSSSLIPLFFNSCNDPHSHVSDVFSSCTFSFDPFLFPNNLLKRIEMFCIICKLYEGTKCANSFSRLVFSFFSKKK